MISHQHILGVSVNQLITVMGFFFIRINGKRLCIYSNAKTFLYVNYS